MKALKILLNIFAGFLATGVLASCEPESQDLAAPVVKFQADEIEVDLNNVDQPSIVCVIEAAAGLSRVEAYTVSEDEEGRQTLGLIGEHVTQFPNEWVYSLNLTPLYSEDMVAVRVVATDKAGKETAGDIPLNVLGIWSATVGFTDENGGAVTDGFVFLEDEEENGPVINVKAESEVGIWKIEVIELMNGADGEIDASSILVKECDGSEEETVQVTKGGVKYVPAENVSRLRVTVTYGPSSAETRTKTAEINVSISPALSIVLDKEPEEFNGVPAGEDIVVSGSAEAAKGDITALTYTLSYLDGTSAPAQDFTVGSDGRFSFSVEPEENLAGITINGATSAGNTAEIDIEVHVGYRLLRLEAQASTNQNTVASNTVFFDSVNGKVYDYMEAFVNQATVDVAFAGWNSFRTIRLDRVKSSALSSNNAKELAGYRPNADWENPYDVPMAVWKTFTAEQDDERMKAFNEAVISDFNGLFEPVDSGSDQAASSKDQTIAVFSLASSGDPEPENIMIFENTAGKKVLLVFEASQSGNISKIDNQTKFTFMAKVEL